MAQVAMHNSQQVPKKTQNIEFLTVFWTIPKSSNNEVDEYISQWFTDWNRDDDKYNLQNKAIKPLL